MAPRKSTSTYISYSLFTNTLIINDSTVRTKMTLAMSITLGKPKLNKMYTLLLVTTFESEKD
ncbi:hypothetical protein AC624_06160 [Bacillus sp. FJAT-27238]|nr:hypothetical protein AC624_06160 [Bacillus sp. FJAT-27238]